MPHKHCEVCNVDLPTDAAEAAHNSGKKHQKLLELRNQRSELSAKSVFIYGFPANSVTEGGIHNAFTASFGSVSSVRMDLTKGTFAIVEFVNSSSASAALAMKKIKVGEQIVAIKERKTDFEPGTDKVPRLDANSVLNQFVAKMDVYHQSESDVKGEEMFKILASTLLDDKLDERQAILSRLNEAVADFMPGECSIVFIGSSATGMAMKYSDIDCTLLTNISTTANNGADPVDESLLRSKAYLLGTDPVKLIGDERITEKEFALLTAGDRIKFLSRMLNYCRKVRRLPITDQRPIYGARCPIVKLVWNGSRIVDLSIDNKYAVENTAWINSILSKGDAFRWATLAINFWSKLGGLSSPEGHALNSYTLMLLFITALQGRNMVPLAGENYDDWFARVAPDYAAITSTDLIKVFFSTYESCIFKDVVVSSRQGAIVSMSSFLANSETAMKGFKVAELNVQDPFEFNHNVGSEVLPKVVHVLEKKLSQTYTRISGASKDRHILNTLLNFGKGNSQRQQLKVELMECESSNMEHSNNGLSSSNNTKSTSNSSSSSSLQPHGFSIQANADQLKTIGNQAWMDRTLAAIDRVLTDLLLLERCEESNPASKKRRLDVDVFEYSAKYRTWQGRQSIRKEIIHQNQDGIDDYRLEQAITKRLMDNSSRRPDELFKFRLVLTFAADENDEHLSCDLSFLVDGAASLEFTTFYHFVEPFLRKLVPLLVG